jgi:ABC-2 type transport system ATP-binding protein
MYASTEGYAATLVGAVVSYGRQTALDGVDLDIERGRVTALLGPNGAGKTTAIRLLLGLRMPDQGRALVFGCDPTSAAARRQTGAMLQISKVPETLRVVEHIETFRAYYATPLPTAALVDLAGLRGLERRLFGTLSGGERQRVLLALALAGNPKLLFLDEPTVGMDVESRRALWGTIRRLRDEGRAVLLTTHYLDEADSLADRIVVLNHGRIIADGTPAEIRGSVPARQISCVTTLTHAQIRAVAAVQHIEQRGDTTVLLTAAPEQTVRALLAADPMLYDLTVGAVALEDAFMALTRAAQEVAA